MRYVAYEKRLIMTAQNLEHIMGNMFSYGLKALQERATDVIMMSLFNEMCSCGCVSPSDANIPEIRTLEIRLFADDTIGIKGKYQNLYIERKTKHGRKRLKANG